MPDTPGCPPPSRADLQRLLDAVSSLPANQPLSPAARFRLLIELRRDPLRGEKYSQAYIAAQTGLSDSVISRILRSPDRRPQADTLHRIAEFFQVPLEFFTSADIGEVLRREMQNLARAAKVLRQADDLGLVATNLRSITQHNDPAVTDLGARASQAAQEVDTLARNPANAPHLEPTLSALEAMIDLLQGATREHEARRQQGHSGSSA
ncbi:helix-turn-helix transcriptional regulator [Nonomuraea fuscirosea]